MTPNEMIIPEELNAISEFVEECGWNLNSWRAGNEWIAEDWSAHIKYDDRSWASEMRWKDISIGILPGNILLIRETRHGDRLFECSLYDPKCFDELKKILDELS